MSDPEHVAEDERPGRHLQSDIRGFDSRESVTRKVVRTDEGDSCRTLGAFSGTNCNAG